MLNGIKSIYVNSVACVRIKGGECECFRIKIAVRQGCIMSLWLFNVYIDTLMKEVKMGMGRRGVSFLEEGREWILPGFLYANDLVLCGESEEDLRVMVRRFADVCRRRGLKVNAGKSKMVVLNGEEGLECEVCVDRIHLEHVSKLKYLVCVMDESGIDDAECNRKVAGGRKVAGAIMCLVNTRSLQLECAMVLHESLLVPVFMYGNETMI